MRTLLLTLHIVAVAAWLGGNFAQIFLMRGFKAGPSTVAAAWFRGAAIMVRLYYSVAGVLLTATGVGLVLTNDAWSFGSGFVSVGFAVVIIGAVLGMVFFAPRADRAASAFEIGDDAAGRAAASSIGTLALVDTALVLLAVVAMVGRWPA